MEVCRDLTGRYGLIEYDWLCRHFRFKLFRLGRLQFMAAPGVMPARVYRNRRGETAALAPDGHRYTPGGEADGTNGRLHPGTPGRRGFGRRMRLPSGTGSLAAARNRRLQSCRFAEWRPVYAPGEPVLEAHIPAGEPLLPRAALESLAEAPRFFCTAFRRMRREAVHLRILDDGRGIAGNPAGGATPWPSSGSLSWFRSPPPTAR